MLAFGHCVRRAAEGDLFADFGVELVGGVFGFRVAVVEVEFVAESAVGADVFAADYLSTRTSGFQM